MQRTNKRPRWGMVLGGLSFGALLLLATGCSDDIQLGDDAPLGAVDAGSGDGTADSGGDSRTPDASEPECSQTKPCSGDQVCNAGQCCASADRVCGDQCCAVGDTCFAGACVKPGSECEGLDDCGNGEYCEPALGSGAIGGDIPGQVCLDKPSTGRCIPLPPACSDQTDADDLCIDPGCEFVPAPGKLNVAQQWSWDSDSTTVAPSKVDIWSSPTVGRLTDTNCDGKVDELDPPNIVFISGDAIGNHCGAANSLVPVGKEAASEASCRTGVLRVLDGKTGTELWALDRIDNSSQGFAAMSIAIGDLDGDRNMEIVAATGEGYVVVIDGKGKVLAKSTERVKGALQADNTTPSSLFGWGGSIALADADGDGKVEAAVWGSVYTIDLDANPKTITLRFHQTTTRAQVIGTFADVDGDPDLEFVGRGDVYDIGGTNDGKQMWKTTGAAHTAVADLDKDGKADIALVEGGKLHVVNAATGVDKLPALALPGGGTGGPPTIADFDGDGRPEIGVAKALAYSVVKLNWDNDLSDGDDSAMSILWQAPSHDLSSSVTGSTVFDFEGDGAAEVVYNDECFLWVYDGKTGKVRHVGLTTSFTGTESSLVADIDGNGHAEILLIANGADTTNWRCNVAPWNQPGVDKAPTDTEPGDVKERPAWKPPAGKDRYRGLRAFRDAENSWVGTRKLWNQHSYHVTNICSGDDNACANRDNHYGRIPKNEISNWTLPWLNNFRQNVQQSGLFDAPDIVLTLRVACTDPPTLTAGVRNRGKASLPKGAVIGFFARKGETEREIGRLVTEDPIPPGRAVELAFTPQAETADVDTEIFFAEVIIDPQNRVFRECREDNNRSPEADCLLK